MNETWKPIPGLEPLYEVSNYGGVRRISSRLLRPDIMKRGYRRVTLSHKGQRQRYQVHRLVMAVFVGVCPPDYVVNHKDGNPSHNYVGNLEYVTQQRNIEHSFKELGRQPAHRGESTHFAKLSDMDVIAIRRLRTEGHTYASIAERFNTKPANVWHICTGKTWKHLL